MRQDQKTQSTKRPWRMTQTSMPSQLLLQGGELKDGNSFSIQMSKENAGLIVKAVNCHDDFISLAQSVMKLDCPEHIHVMAYQLLKKASQ